MDRIDMHIEVPAVSLEEMKAAPGEPSRAVAERVVAARRIQEERFGASCSTPINAAMSSREVQSHCRLDP